MPHDREPRWRRHCVIPVLALCSCDVVFRLDHVRERDAGDDATIVDSMIDAPTDLVAHYRFETAGPVIADETQRHDGLATGDGALASVPGQSGMAIEFPTGASWAYVVVPDSSEFDLVQGSIDLRIRLSTEPGDLGILSRDSSGTSSGQIVLVQRQSMLVLRLQNSTDGGGGGGAFVCSGPLTPGTWIHVGINLGAPKAELWVDGIEQTVSQAVTIFGISGTCGAADARSLVGNDDPFVLGAVGIRSTSGTADMITSPFSGGAIDEMRILETRQDFAQP